MMRKIGRTVAIIEWTMTGCCGWVGSVFGCLWAVLKAREWFGWKLGSARFTDLVIIYGLCGCGTLFATVAALILGIMGKLPGTAKKPWRARGFRVTVTASGEDQNKDSRF
jgi:hypothetical protein